MNATACPLCGNKPTKSCAAWFDDNDERCSEETCGLPCRFWPKIDELLHRLDDPLSDRKQHVHDEPPSVYVDVPLPIPSGLGVSLRYSDAGGELTTFAYPNFTENMRKALEPSPDNQP